MGTIQNPLEGGTKLTGRTITLAPLVSIIIVVFRDREELQQVIESILPHVKQDIELIVIDGGSDDGTVELLHRFDDKIDYWLSEPDKGIYDAMNKGVAASRGEFVLHLNAGDRLTQIPSDSLRQCLKDDIDVASFRVLMDGKDVYIPRDGLKMRIDNCWHHQGTFYRRSKHLGYNPEYHICGDFDHNQRLIKAGCSVRLLPEIVAEHQNNGISMDKMARKEILRSIHEHFGVAYIPIALARLKLNDLRWATLRYLRG
ncbi:MAG: glycosyltransferase family 2 protein [Edaphobacter sp.]